MAAPNLKSPSTITGKVAPYAVTTSLAAALSNGSNSGQCLRINAIRVANTGNSLVNINMTHYRGTTHTYIVKPASIETGSTYVVLQRDEFIYLEEGDALYLQASVAASADALITYDVWS